MSDDDISDWERELENNTPIIADSTILAEIFHKQNEQKQEEILTKEQKNKTALVVPSEDVFMEKWNSLEEKQKALLFKILSTEPIFSSEKDENQARLQQLQEENEKIANMTTEERRAYEREKQEQDNLMAAMHAFGIRDTDPAVFSTTSAPKKVVAKKKDTMAMLEKLEIRNQSDAARAAKIIADKLKLLKKTSYLRTFCDAILFTCATDILSGEDLDDIGLEIAKKASEKKKAEKADYKKQQELRKLKVKIRKEKIIQNNDLFGGINDDFEDASVKGKQKKWVDLYDADDFF